MTRAWRIIELLFALVALGLVTLALVFAFRRYGTDAAAWVQAVGSILAIVAAGAAVQYQLNRADQNRRRAVFAVADAAKFRVDEIAGLVSRDDPRDALLCNFHHSILDRLISAFDASPVHEIQRGDGIVAFLAIRDQLAFLKNAVQALIDGPEKHPDLGKSLDEYSDLFDQDEVSKYRARCVDVLRKNVMTHIASIEDHHRVLLQST